MAEPDPAQYPGPITPPDELAAAPLSALEIVGLLAEEARLRVAAAVVLGATDLPGIMAATGLAGRDVAVALDRLQRGGLVLDGPGGRLHLAREQLQLAARAPAAQEPAPGGEAADPVLRSFVRDRQLVSIPAARSKRLVVLEWLADRFEPGRTYPEAETNRLLREAHPDHAALRRYLVDEGFLERRDGFYWRAGGAFDVD